MLKELESRMIVGAKVKGTNYRINDELKASLQRIAEYRKEIVNIEKADLETWKKTQLRMLHEIEENASKILEIVKNQSIIIDLIEGR